MIKIAITGHANIEKAYGVKLIDHEGQKYNTKAFDDCYRDIDFVIRQYCKERDLSIKDIEIVCGMARGTDEVSAIFAMINGISLSLSIPGSVRWHKDRGLTKGLRAQALFYDQILKYPGVRNVYEIGKRYNGEEYHFVNFARNQNMVDLADVVFSIKAYDSSGTDDCVKRAKLAGKFYGNAYTQSILDRGKYASLLPLEGQSLIGELGRIQPKLFP